MKKTKRLKKLINIFLILIFIFQCSLGSLAEAKVKNPPKVNKTYNSKKTNKLPKNKTIKNKKPYKIPRGIAKNDEKLKKWMDKKELVEERTENSKTFINDDGTKTSLIYFEPIHIKDSKGKYIDIDNTIVQEKKGGKSGYKNKNGLFNVIFSGNDKEDAGIRISKDNITVEIISKDALSKDVKVEKDKIFYPGKRNGTGHLYTLHNSGVKEDVILNHYITNPSFEYEMNLDGPCDIQQEDGVINVVSRSTKDTVFSIAAPYMEDADGNQSYNLKLDLKRQKNKYIINLIPDENWLKEPGRVYPVKIDPSVTIGSSSIYDNYVQENKGTHTHSSEFMMYVGYDDGKASHNLELYNNYKKRTRGYIKFQLPKDINSKTIIDSASLSLYKYTSWSSLSREVQLYKVEKSSNINAITWGTQPQVGSSLAASTTITGKCGYYNWNIKGVVANWAAAGNNYGLMLKLKNESNQADCFYSTNHSANKPYVTINYTNTQTPKPQTPTAGDLELVFERKDIMDNGEVYAKGSVSSGAPKNKATISYKLMPDGTSGQIVKENITSFEWQTPHYKPELDKLYWVEASIKVEKWVETQTNPSNGHYEIESEKSLKSSQFLVCEAQPGDTIKRIAKHYTYDGNKYTEIKELNKLKEDPLIVGQKLFVLTEKAKPLSYKQPKTITPEIEKKDALLGAEPENTETIGQYINSSTGAFAYFNKDFGYQAYNTELGLLRTYNSTEVNRKSPMGNKWDYSFNKYLFFHKDGTIGYNRGDGSRIYFRKDAAGKYSTNAPSYDVLNNAGTYYEIKTSENVRYQFSKTGILTTIVDRNNNKTVMHYDENDWQVDIVDPVNRTTTFSHYDDDTAWSGNIQTVILPDSSEIMYTYDEKNNLQSCIDAEDNETKYSYDGESKLETVILPAGNTIIKNLYMSDGRVKTQYDGEENPISITYEADKTILTDGRGNTYKYYHNSNLWLTKKEYPDGKYEAFSQNARGRVISKIDRMGKEHKYEYNSLGYLKKYTRPDGNTLEYSYKDEYLLEYIKDFNRNETRFTYDGNNNLDETIQYVTEDGYRKTITTDYTYTPQGLLASVTDPDGVTTTIDNSSYPELQTIKDGNNNEYKIYFDKLGRTITFIEPMQNTTRMTYDRNGHVIEIVYPGTADVERMVSYTYDENGNLGSEATSRILDDGGYPVTLYGYDNNNRLAAVADSYGNTTTYGYDKNGNMIKETDPEGYATEYKYDWLNRLENIKYPGDTQWSVSYTYDEINNLKRVEGADGDWTEYAYDYDVNKVKSILNPEGVTTTFNYDNVGNVLTEIMPDNNIKQYVYDELYRVKKVTEPGNIVTEIEYYNSDKVREIKESKGVIYKYNYNSNGQLSETIENFIDPLTKDEVSYKTESNYDENGNRTTVKDSDGNITTYSYNEINKTDKIIDPMSKTQSFSYDEDGNICARTDGNGNTTYIQYDALNRTYKVSIPENNSSAYAYAAGVSEENSTTYTYIYNSRGLLESYIDPMDNVTTYKYNPKGNLEKTINPNNEETGYEYYGDGELKKIIYPNGQSEDFRYDNLNRLVWSKNRAGVEETTKYNVMGNPELVTNNTGDKVSYNYDLTGRLSKITDVLGRSKVFMYNEMNFVSTVKDIDGNLTQYKYDPRGRVRQEIDAEGKTATYNYDYENRITNIKKPGDRSYSFVYDQSGNLSKMANPLGNSTEYVYDNNNAVEEVKDARGYSKKYTYNSLGKLKTATNERGFTTKYEYYPGGLLGKVIDPKQNVTEYTYDQLNRISTMVNPLQETTSYSYDPMGNIKTVTDPRGVTTTYTYTPWDEVESTYDTQNNRTQKIFSISGDLEQEVDQENRITSYEYDKVHRVTKVTEPGGYRKNYEYDPSTGDVSKVVDNAGGITTYKYDKMHRLLSETDVQDNVTEYTYDDFGNLKTKTTPDGNTVTYAYDELDRVIGILDPENNMTKYHYDAVGNLDYVIKPGEQRYEYAYDPANNLEKITNPLGQNTTYTYDENNNIATMLDPSGDLYTYNYDALNRLVSVQDLTNKNDTYHYDTSGNIDRITDGNNNTTYYRYNNLNQLEWIKDGEENITQYTYYKDGRLRSMTDGRSNTSSYTYDKAGNLASFTNPLGEVKSFEYNLLGQTTKTIKPDGKETNYQYDRYNRLASILYPGGDEVDYEYDNLNRKTSMTDSYGTTNYSYDKMGRMTGVTDPVGENISYEYDSRGRKTKLIYPDGKFAAYEYDEQDRLVKVTDRDGRATTYAYDEAGRRKSTSLPNGITTIYTYDKASRIVEIESKKENGEVVQKLSYSYDGAGNKTKEEITREGKNYLRQYTYFKNNTVKSMTETGSNNAEYHYRYDEAGNIIEKRVTEDDTTKTYTYSYNEANRMTAESENGETRRKYKYDASGNMTQRIISEGGGVIDYFYYDDADRLEEIVEHNGKVFDYGYNGDGDRIWRTYTQYPQVKPPVDEGERPGDNPTAPGWNKNDNKNDDKEKGNGKGKDKEHNDNRDKTKNQNNGKGNDNKDKGSKGKEKKTGAIENLKTFIASIDARFGLGLFASKPKEDKEKDKGNKGDKTDNKGNGEDKTDKNDKDKGNGAGKDNGSKGNGDNKDKGNNVEKDKGNNGEKSKDNADHKNGNDKEKIKDNNGKGNTKEHTNNKDKKKVKENRGKHLGWYKRKNHPKYPGDTGGTQPGTGTDTGTGAGTTTGGEELTKPEVFEVTNYINDINQENTEVLMTTDVNGDYRAAYTYGLERIGVEDLMEVEGKPNNPLYYLQDALGSVTAITNMNGGIIDSNRFAPYGEPLDPVAKNARLTNSPYGFTGEMHDIEGRLLYLRARYYSPEMMRFIQQDTMFGEIKEPLSRNLYIYGNGNPLKYVDPSGHIPVMRNKQDYSGGPTLDEAAEMAANVYFGQKGDSALLGGWKLIDVNEVGGLRMAVYGRVGEDRKTEYVIANAGTKPTSLVDWKNNLQQPFGSSADMWNSIKYAKKFIVKHPNANITFVGHSKGGAEAAANAVATNKNAILFNPATVNLGAYKLDCSKYTGEVTAYIVKGEVLNNIFGLISKPIDKVVYLPSQYHVHTASGALNVINSIRNHSMDAVKKAIKEWEGEK